MSVQTNLACPECGNDICIDTQLLLAGTSFSCSNPRCGVTIQLNPSDSHQVQMALDQFEQIKSDALNLNDGSSPT
jgi:uncharacterized paraquat-inducible protein A